MTAVLFDNVSRYFGAVRAVDRVNLAIAEGEFFAMLGPSGSGKTTCLRLMAGFEQPTEAISRSSARLPKACRRIGAASIPSSRTTPSSRISPFSTTSPMA